MTQKIILDPVSSDESETGSAREFFLERTDRNLGWISQEEQQFLRNTVIGVAGCGGMGGLIASIFLRLGVGEIRIADSEEFDLSNLNRQFAATQQTVGKSKAKETARMLRDISNDTKIVVYPEGITEDTAKDFVTGCDLIFDEIEFWAVGSRILLHVKAEEVRAPLITCSSVGLGSRLFWFDHTGMRMSEMLGISLDDALTLQHKIQTRAASESEVRFAMKTVLDALIPELPGYSPAEHEYQDRAVCIDRLLNQQRASIIATNPPLAAGFAADFGLIRLLSDMRLMGSGVVPQAPDYLYLDIGHLRLEYVERLEVSNDIY